MRIWQVFLLAFASHTVFAQGKYDANWVFGIRAGISFDNIVTPVNFNTLSNDYAASASISDSLGNLLFYIAPDSPFAVYDEYGYANTIYDGNNNVISNGDSLNIESSLTGAVFIPVPETPNSYYIFYMQWNEYDNLLYGVIVKDSSSATYRVTEKNKTLCALPLEWGIAAVKHANGNDWWLLVHEGDSVSPTNTFYEFLVTKDSILGPFSLSIGSLHSGIYSYASQLKFSPSGNWLASSLVTQNQVDLFNFDRCTGQLLNFTPLTNIDSINDLARNGYCEFSPSENALYISEGSVNSIDSLSGLYQYDLTNSNINSSRHTIFTTDSFQINFGDLHLAPDSQIYLAIDEADVVPYRINQYDQFNQYLWIIKSPNSIGTACNFIPYGYYLGDSARTYMALPNIPNYNLGVLSIYQGTGWNTSICNGDSIIIGNPPVANVTYAWQPAAGITDTTLAQQTVKPDTSTWYYVTLTDTTINYSCQSVTDSFFVQVVNCCDSLLLSQCTLSKDTSLCANTISGVTLSVDTVPGISFVWQAALGFVNLHATQQTVNPLQSTWYYVNFFSDSNSSLPCNQRVDSVLVQVINCCDSSLLSQCTLSKDTFICTNVDTPTKGAVLSVDTVPGVSFVWQSATGISVRSTQQIVDPSQSTWYYVTFYSDTDSASACNQRKDSVYVEVKKCMVGIDEINLVSQRLNIYPNPAQNIAVVEWQPVNGQLQIFITDLLGQEVSRFEADGMSGKIEMDISGLANGMYVVRILGNDGEVLGNSKLAVVR